MLLLGNQRIACNLLQQALSTTLLPGLVLHSFRISYSGWLPPSSRAACRRSGAFVHHPPFRPAAQSLDLSNAIFPPAAARSAALRSLRRLLPRMQLGGYASAILHPLMKVGWWRRHIIIVLLRS